MLRKLHDLYVRYFGDPIEKQVPVPADDPTISLGQGRARAYEKKIRRCVERLSAKYDVERHQGLQGRLRAFGSPGNHKDLTLLHSYRVRSDQGKCYWLSLAFQERVSDEEGLEEMVAIRHAVMVKLRFNAGSVMIRPENLRDKVFELFGGIDIDLHEHRKFSRKYFLLANDEPMARDKLPDSFLNLVATYSGLIVRINGDQMLVGYDRGIRPRDALRLTEFAFAASLCE